LTNKTKTLQWTDHSGDTQISSLVPVKAIYMKNKIQSLEAKIANLENSPLPKEKKDELINKAKNSISLIEYNRVEKEAQLSQELANRKAHEEQAKRIAKEVEVMQNKKRRRDKIEAILLSPVVWIIILTTAVYLLIDTFGIYTGVVYGIIISILLYK